MSYASVEDLESRYLGPIPANAAVLLEDASMIIDAYKPNLAAEISAGTLDLDVVKMINCRMVIRTLQNPEGASTSTQMAGPFSLTLNRGADATNGLYLSKLEKKLLQIPMAGSFPHYYAGLADATTLG